MKKTNSNNSSELQLADVSARARQGDEEAIRSLMSILHREAHPELQAVVKDVASIEGIINALGSIAHQAKMTWMHTINPNPVATEAMWNKIEKMRKELSGPSPSPVEALLIERIIVCSLHTHYLDLCIARQFQGQTPIDLVRFYETMLDKSNRRYLSAIKTLATVRKLGIPSIQVNIADKQINVSGDMTK